MNSELLKVYCRLLGARIGKGVQIDPSAVLGEYDLLTIEDHSRIDKATVRGFCVERAGRFRLAPIHVGRRVTINTYTHIAPGSNLEDDIVIGPHASSYDSPASTSAVHSNRHSLRQPHWLLVVLLGWPIIAFIVFVSYIPWIAAIYCMVEGVVTHNEGFNPAESVIIWFATPHRIAYHLLARVLRDVLQPLVQVVCGIMVKRAMGLNSAGEASIQSHWLLLQRYITQVLLSQKTLQRVGDVFGTHYEVTSVSCRTDRWTTYSETVCHRSYGALWEQRSANVYIGLALVSIAPTLSYSRSGTTSCSGHALNFSPQTVLGQLKS